jgi:hypothetical protein
MVASKSTTETTMKRPEMIVTIPQHDYAPAVQSALSWLGDRYLLAAPAPRRPEERKPYFGETRSWHRAAPKRTLTRH